MNDPFTWFKIDVATLFKYCNYCLMIVEFTILNIFFFVFIFPFFFKKKFQKSLHQKRVPFKNLVGVSILLVYQVFAPPRIILTKAVVTPIEETCIVLIVRSIHETPLSILVCIRHTSKNFFSSMIQI